MPKPTPPDVEPEVTTQQDSTVQKWLESHSGPVSAEDAGMRMDAGPQPLAPATPPYEIQEYLDSAERALPLMDEQVKCNKCRWGWIMAEVAPTKNKKPDGSPFLRFKGFCTFGGGRMSLGDIRPVQCNRFAEEQRR